MAKKKEAPKSELPKTIQKPWGHEVLIAQNDLYVVKQLFVKAGHKLSLQIHEQKFEHITLVSGAAQMYMETEQGMSHFLMPTMTPIEIAPGTIHRLAATDTEDAVLVEVSTNHLDDVIRLEDDYGRADPVADDEEGNYGIDTVDEDDDD